MLWMLIVYGIIDFNQIVKEIVYSQHVIFLLYAKFQPDINYDI